MLHFSLVPEDFHDWDVSGAPTVTHTRGGHSLVAATPKDGFLYGYDLGSDGIQRVAFVAGTNSPIWPVDKKTAKIVVFALGD